IRILVHLSREGDPASRIRSNDDPVTSPQREMAGRDCGNSGRSRTLENLDLLDLHQEFGGGERPAVGAREGWNCCPFRALHETIALNRTDENIAPFASQVIAGKCWHTCK